MNKREKFWIHNLLWFSGFMVIFIGLSMFNIIKFNSSYMEEEQAELKIFQRQTEWAITPLLKAKDYKSIQEYCNDFVGNAVNFKIYDGKKELIASSIPNDKEIVLDENEKLAISPTNKLLSRYKESIKNKKIGLIDKIEVNNNEYYIKVICLEEDVMKSIIHAQSNLIVFIIIFSLFFILGFVYIVQKLRVPFNEFEESVRKIADGDLTTVISVPKLAVLEELAISVKKMTKRLKNQIERLQQLEQYKSEFLQNVSHEIKTPITAINSAVELLGTNCSNLPPESQECLDIINFQTKYINTLVNDILSLSEIDEEKINKERVFKKLTLNDVVENAINYSNTGEIKIVKNIPENNIEILGDEELLIRAVSNLITNAIKYSQSSQIDVSLERVNDTVQIKVKDYGIGIDKKYLPMLFERFYRVDKARSRKSGGTGLGLAIVKNIVELHNGEVTVNSDINKGCEFIITIPIK